MRTPFAALQSLLSVPCVGLSQGQARLGFWPDVLCRPGCQEWVWVVEPRGWGLHTDRRGVLRAAPAGHG